MVYFPMLGWTPKGLFTLGTTKSSKGPVKFVIGC